MRKYLQRLLLAAVILLPWATQAQSSGALDTVPYFCNFEDSVMRSHWVMVSQVGQDMTYNHFVVSSDTNANVTANGQWALYVTDETWACSTCSYPYHYKIGSDQTGASTYVQGNSYAYTDIFFPDAGIYDVSYWWKCTGESRFDHARIALVPNNWTFQACTIAWDSTTTVPGQYWGAYSNPSSFIVLDNHAPLSLSNGFELISKSVTVPSAGVWRLAVMWRNDGNIGENPPISFDDISIIRQSCPAPQNVSVSHLTQTSGVLTWDNAQAAGWIVEWDTIGVVNRSHSAYVTSNQFSLQNLTPGGRYSMTVRTVCNSGDTSLMVPYQFATPTCPLITELPYSFDFDSVVNRGSTTTLPSIPCWTHFSNATTYYGYPYFASAAARVHTGTYGLYFSYPSSTSATYDPFAGFAMPAIDVDSIDLRHVVVSFWLSSSSTSYYPNLQVGIMTDPNDGSTFVPVDSASTNSTSAQHFEISLVNYQGTGNYIAFRMGFPTEGYAYAYGYLDDVELLYEDCIRPGVIIDSITTTAAGFHWSNLGAQGYQYATSVAGQSNPTSTSDTTLALTGLTPNTNYSLYVRSVCTGGVLGAWTAVNFRTACDYLSVPYFEDFESATSGTTSSTKFMNCWHHINNSASYPGYPYISASTTYNHTTGGGKGIYWMRNSSSTYGDYQYLILPPTSASVDSLLFGFWLKASTATYIPRIYIGVMDDPDSIQTFTVVDSCIHNAGTDWIYYDYPLSSYAGSGRYITMYAYNQGATWYAYVDDISLDYIPACYHPTGLTLDSATATSLSFHWNGPSNASEWIVEVDSMFFTTNNTHLTVNNLSASSGYSVSVMAVCGAGDTSSAISQRFRTACGAISTVPYTEGFEDYAVGSTSATTFIPCWNRFCNGGTMRYPYVNGTTNNIHSGYKALLWQSAQSTSYPEEEIVVLPQINTVMLPIETLQLSFWGRPTTATATPMIEVGTMSNPDSANSFVAFDTVNLIVGTAWNLYKVPFVGYNGNDQYIALRYVKQGVGTAACAFSMDDLVIDFAPNCMKPTNVVQTVVAADSMSLSWDANGAYTWLVLVNGNDSYEVTDSVITLSNLDPNSLYSISIAALCDGDTSDFETVQMATECVPIASLPWTDGFENYTASTSAVTSARPICYDYQMLSHSTTYATGDYMPTIYYYTSGTTYRHSGNYSYRLYGTSYVVLPEFSMPIDSLMMTVWMSRTANDAACEIGVLDANNVFHPIAEPSFGSTIAMKTVYFNSYDGPAGRIAFHNYSATYDYAYVYLDDITIDRLPSCVPPTATVSNVTYNEATVSWNGGNASSYEVLYGSNSIVVNGTSTTLTGLNPNSSYSVMVRGICGAGDTSIWSNTCSFTTFCAPASIPYTENFDSITDVTTAATGFKPSCWTYTLTNPSYASESYAPTVYYSAAYANSGNYSLRLYSAGYHCLPMMAAPLDSLQLNFMVYTTGTAYGLEVGVMEGSTFVPIQDVSGTYQQRVQRTVYFNGYNGSSRIIAFRNYNTTNPTAAAAYSYIDDIEVDYAPYCLPVAGFHTTDVTATSATVHWRGTPAPYYEVEYGPAGFSRGQGTTEILDADSIALSGLSASCAYEIYVRAYCDSTDTADWAHYAFTAECGEVVSFPYFIDFENAMTTANGNSLPGCWASLGNSGHPTVFTGQYQSGSHGLFFSYDSPSNYQAAILPAMGLPLDALQLDFSLFKNGAVAGTGEIIVGVLTDPSNYSTFTPVDTLFNTTANSWAPFSVSFANYTDTGRYIAFVCTGTGPRSRSGQAAIDDVTVSYIPCVVNIQVDSVTGNAAYINWADSCGSTQWEVEYGPRGFAHGQGTSVSTYSHPYAITGLNAASRYDFYIRPISSSDTGFWSLAGHFSTLCAPMDVPFYQDFEFYQGTSYTVDGELPNCWNSYGNGASNYFPHIVGSGTLWYPHSGSKALCMTVSSLGNYGDTKIVSLPELSEPISAVQLSFWLCTQDNVAQGGRFDVGYLTTDDPTAFSSNFVPAHTIYANDSTVHNGNGLSTTGGHTYTFTFDSVPDEAVTLAFRWSSTTGAYSCFVDDVVVDFAPVPCNAPVVTEVAASYNAATFNWTGEGSTFELAIRYVDLDEWDDAVILDSAFSYTFTSLEPATSYLYHIRQICDTSRTSDWVVGSFTTDELPCFAPYNLQAADVYGTAAIFTWDADESQSYWSLNVFNSTYNMTYPFISRVGTVTDLTPGTTYYAAVQAHCANGNSDWSDTISFTTTVCDPVSNLAASVNGTSATLSWTPGANNNGMWEIEYGLAGFSQGEGTKVQVSNTTATINNLLDETSYDAYVRAVCGDNYVSNWSDKVSFTTEHIGISHVQGSMTLSIYPNPANGSTTISLSGVDGLVNIEIVDMNGRTLLTDAMECQGDCAKTLTVSNLAQGAYFVRIYSDEVNTVKKLIVR